MSKYPLTPAGDFRRARPVPPCDDLTARLFRSGGTWWLEYSDGRQENTFQAAGPGQFRKADIEKYVTTRRDKQP